MSTICGVGGASTAKPGFGATVAVSAAEIGAFLSTLSWGGPLALLAGYIGLVTYDLATFCNNDPAAMPSDSALNQALLDLVGDPISRLTGISIISDALSATFWPQFCTCTTGAYVPYTTPVITGPTINPLSGACANIDSGAIPMGGANKTNMYGTGADPNNVTPLTAGQTYCQMECWITPSGGSHPAGTFAMSFDAEGGGELGPAIEPTGHATSGGPHVFFGEAIYANAFGLEVGFSTDALASTTDIVECIAHFYCDGQMPVGMPTTGCCESTTSNQQLQSILDLVTLIQRQIVPFAYVLGAAHPISGAGSIGVQGLIGLKLVLDTIGPEINQESGDPNALQGAGWINWGNADGWSARQYIDANPFVSFPSEAGQYTLIGYSLPGANTGTITELVREAS